MSGHSSHKSRPRRAPHRGRHRPGRRPPPRQGPREDVLYGRQPVAECLKAARRQSRLLITASTARPSKDLDDILALAQEASVPVERQSAQELDALLGDVNHQGVCLHVSPYPYVSLETAIETLPGQPEPPALILALDHIQDPQNLGAVLRNADGAGVAAVLIPKDRACDVTPTVVRASAGAAEHVRIVRVTNLVRALHAMQKTGFWVAGLESCGGSRAYTETDLSGRLCLVTGSEGKGLGRLVRETCDMLISLPMLGRVGSLNAASATGIALYEIRRQQLADQAPER